MSVKNCYFCDYKTLVQRNIEQHFRTHTKEKPFLCKEENCYLWFVHQGTLDTHWKNVHKIVKFKESSSHNCYFCSQELRCLSALASHMFRHTRERPFKCVYNKCKMFSDDAWARNQHVLVCNYNPKLKNNLLQREKMFRKVLSDGQFQCYFCLKNFMYKKTLFSHIKRHTGELFSVSCFGCKRQFNYRDIWKHRTSCIKERQLFMCPFCNCSKGSSWELNFHIQSSHTKDNVKIKCYFCSVNVVERRMGEHLTTHTQEKVFKCGNCNVRYGKYRTLHGHIASKHRDTEEGRKSRRKFRKECYFCKKILARFETLRNHMAKHTMETRRSKIA